MDPITPNIPNFSPTGEEPIHTVPRRKKFYILGTVLVFVIVYFVFFSAPINFPVKSVVSLEPGIGLRGASYRLKEAGIIRSRLALEAFIVLRRKEHHIVAGDYLFEKKLSVWSVSGRISRGERDTPVKVTIPEGFNISQINKLLGEELVNFNQEAFLSLAENKEGYLFPDTYFFFHTENPERVVKIMNDNFIKKIEPLKPEIESYGKTEKEIITMASIVEKEAKGDVDREVIAGILWKRIEKGMALQVDAAPETYDRKGLPKAPISNPGLSSIKAAIHPEDSPYFYYLHDEEGNIHYAKNFEEHKANRLKYLK